MTDGQVFEVWTPALFGWTVLGPYDKATAQTVASRLPGSRVNPAREGVTA